MAKTSFTARDTTHDKKTQKISDKLNVHLRKNTSVDPKRYLAKKAKHHSSDTAKQLVGIMTSAGYITPNETAPIISDAEARDFKACDQIRLNTNEYKRSLDPATKVAGAAVYSTAAGKFAIQFTPPILDPINGSQWRPITNIGIQRLESEEILRAETPNGTKMRGKRSLQISVGSDQQTREYQWWRLSPVPMDIEDEAAKNRQQPLLWRSKRAAQDMPHEIKAKTWRVGSREDILEREQTKRRKPSQSTVMGRKHLIKGYSAHDAGNDYLTKYKAVIHPDRVTLLKVNQAARTQHSGNSSAAMQRYEWGHGQGFGLSSVNDHPQCAENLAAMPKWLNSLMLVCERTAKWIRLHRHNAEILGHFEFHMVPDSDLLDHGILKFEFTENGRKVVLQQSLLPWQTNPAFPRSSDIWQTVHITSELLAGHIPSNIQPVGDYLPGYQNRTDGTLLFSQGSRSSTRSESTYEDLRLMFEETMNSLKAAFGVSATVEQLQEPDSIYKRVPKI